MFVHRLALACLVVTMPLSAVAQSPAAPPQKVFICIQVVEFNVTRLKKKKFDFGEHLSGKQLAWLTAYSEDTKFYSVDSDRDASRVIDEMVDRGLAERLSGVAFDAPLGQETNVHAGETLSIADNSQPDTDLRRSLGTIVSVTPTLINATTARVDLSAQHMRVRKDEIGPSVWGQGLNRELTLQLGQLYATIGWRHKLGSTSDEKSVLFTLIVYPAHLVAGAQPR